MRIAYYEKIANPQSFLVFFFFSLIIEKERGKGGGGSKNLGEEDLNDDLLLVLITEWLIISFKFLKSDKDLFVLSFKDAGLYDETEEGGGAELFGGGENVDNLPSFNC